MKLIISEGMDRLDQGPRTNKKMPCNNKGPDEAGNHSFIVTTPHDCWDFLKQCLEFGYRSREDELWECPRNGVKI